MCSKYKSPSAYRILFQVIRKRWLLEIKWFRYNHPIGCLPHIVHVYPMTFLSKHIDNIIIIIIMIIILIVISSVTTLVINVIMIISIIISIIMVINTIMLLSTPLHQRAASRVQHPNHVAANSLSPPGGKERLHFVGIRPEVQARKGGW